MESENWDHLLRKSAGGVHTEEVACGGGLLCTRECELCKELKEAHLGENREDGQEKERS